MIVLTNAHIVRRDRVLLGTLAMRGALIEAVAEGRSSLGEALDCEGDFIIPGLVDVHTDNLERQVQPRNTARWPSRSALVAHDAQCAAAGLTTVLDALCVGDLGFDTGRVQTYREGFADLDAMAGTGLFKSEHFLHLRCELPAADMLEQLELAIGSARLRMVSMMDHSPGVGQYANIDNYRAMRRRQGLAADFIERRIEELQAQREQCRPLNRRALLARVAGLGIPLASHDDRTEEEIRENVRDGVMVSEFPVRIEAARAARAHGMQIVAGAPNIVRGGSHSGNVAVAELIGEGVVDALASDYVPASLAEAAFMAADLAGISLPAAVALVTDRPSRLCGLTDRGRIAEGLRADLVQVHVHEGLPVVRQVWRAGERVA
jgi:alpha-D-ribose 1-methylphosphonate 5-triphosphate diphosphatase